MNPIHAVTDRLGNKGTIALAVVILLGAFAALDYRNFNAPSPRVTMLGDAWQAFDRAALSRDAPQRAFDSAMAPLLKQESALDTMTGRGPELNEKADKAFHVGLTNLRECQAWLMTYRGFPVSSEANEVRDNARDHVDACTEAHPLDTVPRNRGIDNDDH